MWWERTSWFYHVGFSTFWFDNEGLHFTARFDTHSGDLVQFSTRIVAQFYLSADRMPAGGRRYVSAPIAEVWGIAHGFTEAQPLLYFGDMWAKCWLNTRQTVFALKKPDLGSVAVAGGIPASESRQLIFLEDAARAEFGRPLPGLLAMPPVAFWLPENPFSVTVELEWEFLVQLEGGAEVNLGHHSQVPVCVLKHPQWPIREL
jgi:hypothetical protein